MIIGIMPNILNKKWLLALLLILGVQRSSFALLDGSKPVFAAQEQRSAISSVMYSSDGLYTCLAYDDGTIKLRETARNNLIAAASAHKGKIRFALFSSDKKYVVSAGEDKSVKVWSLPELNLVCETALDYIPSFASCSGGPSSAAVSDDKGNIKVLSLSSLRVTDTLTGEGKKATYISYSKDSRCVSGYEDGSFRLWSSFSMPLKTVQAHSGAISFLGYANGEKYLITAGADGKARIWETKGLTQKGPDLELPRNITKIAASASMRYLAMLGSDNSIQFLLLPKGDPAEPFKTELMSVASFGISPDDKYFMLCGSQGEIDIFRNPFMVAQYNGSMDRGDQAMASGIYEMAMAKYADALSFFPEKEAQEKLQEAQRKRLEKQQKVNEDMRKMKEKVMQDLQNIRK